MKIYIATPSNAGRSVNFCQFTQSVNQMLMAYVRLYPDDIIVQQTFGGLRIDASRNKAICEAKKNKADVFLFLDDDMTFPSDMMIKLRKHWETGKEIVSGLYCSKAYPYQYFLNPIEIDGWMTVYEQKVYQVKLFATGCLWIDMKIFDRIAKPYFLLRCDVDGDLHTTEDCYFAINCHMNGVNAYVDTTILCNHIDVVQFPKVFEHPYVNYSGIMEFRNGLGNITKKTDLENTSKFDILPPIIYPTAGFYTVDGIDDCCHLDCIKLADNLYKCNKCGLIYK